MQRDPPVHLGAFDRARQEVSTQRSQITKREEELARIIKDYGEERRAS